MKIEIGEDRPGHFKEVWPHQYEVFSHFEFACGIPSVLFAVTTLKENGMPNVNFSAWGSFTGGGNGYYALLPGILPHTHTYQNILRTKEFVVNFVSKRYYGACIATIEGNDEAVDEIALGGFTREASQRVLCPRLGEAFICLECHLDKVVPLGEDGASPLLIGRVRQVAVQEDYARGLDKKYTDEGFMLNINEPLDLFTGEVQPSAAAVCRPVPVP